MTTEPAGGERARAGGWDELGAVACGGCRARPGRGVRTDPVGGATDFDRERRPHSPLCPRGVSAVLARGGGTNRDARVARLWPSRRLSEYRIAVRPRARRR